MTNDKLLTKREVAEKLRVSQKTVDVYRSQGTLPSVRIGHKVLFYESKVEKALQTEKPKTND